MRLFHNGLVRRACAVVFAVVVGCLLLAPQPANADTVSCRDMYFPVTVFGTSQTMYGRLCAPAAARTIVVLIPGGSYNTSYWDIGYQPAVHSFRLAMNNAGYATLAVDRLGAGRSSTPLSALVTATVQAIAVHQVIQAVRAGKLGQSFGKVVVGAHSIGSAMAMIEAGTYHDVNGVLVTGMTHQMKWTTVGPVLARMIPAPLDPRLYVRGLDMGYLTTDPGARYGAFHSPGPYDAGAITYDESTKDVFAVTEAVDTTLLTTVVDPISDQITVPVMIAMGDDPNFCGAPLGSDCTSADTLRQSESPFYLAAPSLTTYVLHGYGHSINYAPNAPNYFQATEVWLAGL